MSFFSQGRESTSSRRSIIPIETNDTGAPRAKAAAARLRQWDRTRQTSILNTSHPSYRSDGMNNIPDESSEDDEMEELELDRKDRAPNEDMSDNDGSPQASSPKNFGYPDERDRTPSPLLSYEQRVLNLKKGGDQGDVSKAATQHVKQSAHEKDENQLRKEHSHRKKLLMREKLLEEERLHKELVSRNEDNGQVNAVQASKVIVSVARVKLKMMEQKMKWYDESEAKQNDGTLRASKLLEWTASLSVLCKFAEKMKTTVIHKKMEEQYLRSLPAPPPPPPLEAPPDQGDEDLHGKYEALIEKYRPLWMEEGRKALGEEKFQSLQNMKDGPANKEKKMVAKILLDQALGVLSQEEYLEKLRNAWRLSDDHEALEEYDSRLKHEFARKVANSDNAAESSSSSTKRRL